MKKIVYALFVLVIHVHASENINKYVNRKITISEKTFIKVGTLFWRYDNKSKKIVNVNPPTGAESTDAENLDLQTIKINRYDVISEAIVQAPNNREYIYFNGYWMYSSHLTII